MIQIRGLIRNPKEDILQVFSPMSDSIVTCYYDSYSKTYCIPDYTDSWQQMSSLESVGWRLSDTLSPIKAYSPKYNAEADGYRENVTDKVYMIGFDKDDGWISDTQFSDNQWVDVENITNINFYNPSYAMIVNGKFSSDIYCIPGYTSSWQPLTELFDLGWVTSNKVESISMYNPLVSYTDIKGVSYLKDEYSIYYSHPKVTDWLIKDDIYENNYRFSSNVSTVKFYNPKLKDRIVDGKLDSDSDNNYCIPSYINTWTTLSSIFKTDFRLNEGITSAAIYNPVLDIESTLIGSSNSDYCIPGYINDWSSLEDILDSGWLLTSSLDDSVIINNLLEQSTCKYNAERDEYFIVGVTSNLITKEQLYADGWRFYNNTSTSLWFNPRENSSNTYTATYSIETDEYVIKNIITRWTTPDRLASSGWRSYNSLSNSQWYNPTNNATVTAKGNSSKNEYCIPGYIDDWKTSEYLVSDGWRRTSIIDSITLYNPTLNPPVKSAVCKFTEDNEYCVPGYVDRWVDLDTLQSLGWRQPNNSSMYTVFNASIETQPLVECYYDSLTDKYSVPGYTDWLTKDQMATAGWRFVDGEVGIYRGLDLINVVEDSDSSD